MNKKIKDSLIGMSFSCLLLGFMFGYVFSIIIH